MQAGTRGWNEFTKTSRIIHRGLVCTTVDVKLRELFGLKVRHNFISRARNGCPREQEARAAAIFTDSDSFYVFAGRPRPHRGTEAADVSGSNVRPEASRDFSTEALKYSLNVVNTGTPFHVWTATKHSICCYGASLMGEPRHKTELRMQTETPGLFQIC